MKNLLTLLFSLTFLSCSAQTIEKTAKPVATNSSALPKNITEFDTTYKTIHIFVALCDNKYQGIVPVPAKIGNGQDAFNNLYWGCGFGIRTYFKNSSEWKLVKSQKIDSILMERIVFKHVTKN